MLRSPHALFTHPYMEIDGDDAPSTAGREELSRAGVLQVHELLRTAKGLLDAHAVGVVPSKQEPKQEPQPEESAAPAAQQQQGAAPDGTDTAAKLHALQQQYQAVVAGLRRTLQQCKELEESEASSRSAGALAGSLSAPPFYQRVHGAAAPCEWLVHWVQQDVAPCSTNKSMRVHAHCSRTALARSGCKHRRGGSIGSPLRAAQVGVALVPTIACQLLGHPPCYLGHCSQLQRGGGAARLPPLPPALSTARAWKRRTKW